MLRYIELNLREEYTPEVFSFIKKKMQERAEEEWRRRFRKMKETLGWTYDDMARYMGASSGNSVKASVSRGLPAFAKLAVCVFEAMEGREKPSSP